ncbi:MAG: phosphoribosylamine--glycine ligase [Myxococcota bacterium]
MRVLVLGSGGREHALVWAIGRSPLVEDVLCAPGSDAIAREARVSDCDLGNPDAIVELARGERSDLVVVGPEAPLVAGIADRLEAAGIAVFGPSAKAARLEGSKAFAKELMQRLGIPTAAYRIFNDASAARRYVLAERRPLVVKVDGLAAGKGVSVCDDAEEAVQAVHEAMELGRFGAAGARLVIEEKLVGEEASFYAICDGETSVRLAAAQDHKRALDGDRGENTGGMGAYSPTPFLDADAQHRVEVRIVRPLLQALREAGTPYRGVLYVGLMLVDGEPHVIEFNVRFGDPETQPLLFRMESDLVPLLLGAARGNLGAELGQMPGFGAPAVCVVLASDGYPRGYATGFEIQGLDRAARHAEAKVFHAGTRLVADRWVTAGGRVLGVTARGATLREARERAYAVAGEIRFKGMRMRRDIAQRGVGALER